MENSQHLESSGSSLELAKWVALVAMTVDHAGKIVVPEWYLETHCFGRLAYPLFAAIIGFRLAAAPGLSAQYLRRLLLWAIASQPIYVLAGKQWLDLNIFVTLAAGVLLAIAFDAAQQSRLGTALGAACVGVLVAPLCEFGVAGVLAIPLLMVLARDHPARRAWIAGPIGVFANLVPEAPFLVPSDLWALGATPVLYLSMSLEAVLPRLPSLAFYAYYPLHLLILDRIDRWW